MLIKIDQSLLNGQYGSAHIVPNKNFSKNISSSKKELSMESYGEPLKGHYGSNHILSLSEFPISAFDKNRSMFSKWTI